MGPASSRAQIVRLTRNDVFLAGFPACAAKLAGLASRENAVNLIGVTADVGVMNSHILKFSFGIDDVGCACRETFFLDKSAVVSRNSLGNIADQRISELAEILFHPAFV